MAAHPPAFAAGETAGAVVEALSAREYDLGAYVYVVDDGRAPQGLVPTTRLLTASRDTALRDLAQPLPALATADMDQERVGVLAANHGLSEVAVTNEAGELVGAVQAHTLIHVLRQEHIEDMHRFVGIIHQANYAAHALEISPWRRVRNRLPWLLVGLAGSAVSAVVMAGYETALSANIAVAFFVPGIVYLADAIGTQTEAVAVRGLSLTHAPLSSILAHELTAGLLIGLILALLAAPLVVLWFGQWELALAVSVSIVAAGGAATSIGLLLPWLLSRAGSDPAFGSGPLATVIQDLLSILIYLGVVTTIVA
jgi:magnesium transporter